MAKKDAVLIGLGKSPKAWSKYLLDTRGIPEEPQGRYEVSESTFVSGETGLTVPLAEIAGSRGVGSFTQQTDEILSIHQEASVDESIVLSAQWLLYLQHMDVIAEALSPKDNGANLKQLALADARSRHWEQPPQLRPESETPAKFKQRWVWRELEIRARTSDRRTHVIEIWEHSIPPDEQEDLDEAGEPRGHWDGLTWTPEPTED